MRNIVILGLFLSVNALAAKNINIIPKKFDVANINVELNFPDSITGAIENKVSYSLPLTITLKEIDEYYSDNFNGEWRKCFSNIEGAKQFEREIFSAWFHKKRKLGVFLSTNIGKDNERHVVVIQYNYKNEKQFKNEFKGAGC